MAGYVTVWLASYIPAQGPRAPEDFRLWSERTFTRRLIDWNRNETLPLVTESLPHGHQVVRIAVRQRAQEHTVDDAEDRRIRPDAERQRERGHRSEARVLDHHPLAVA